MKRILWLIMGWFLLAHLASAASFDCAKASSKVEHLICDDPVLSRLDDELAQAYKVALQDRSGVETIRQAQKRWMKERNACIDTGCVQRSYEMRQHELASNQVDLGHGEELTEVSASKHTIKKFCAEIKQMFRKVESTEKGAYQTSRTYELDKFYLHGEGTSVEEFHGLDIDDDGAEDIVEKSCSASAVQPSDPCLLSIKLSSGEEFDFEGWDIRLMKYQSKLYVIAHHDDDAQYRLFSESPNQKDGVIFHPEVAAAIKYELYEIGKSGTVLMCKGL